MDLSIVKDIIIPIAAILAAAVGGFFSLYIYFENSKLRKAEWLYSLFEKFFCESNYAEIRQLIDYGSEAEIQKLAAAIKNRSDIALEERLVNYLNFFEFIANLWLLKQVHITEVKMMFEYYIKRLGDHQFLNAYLADNGFEGVRKLTLALQKCDHIFVYGTLRSDAKNEMYKLLAKHAKLVSKASFSGKLFKIDYYPGAVPSEGTADKVFGEVYEIIEPESVLPLLDKYEECGPGFEAPTEYVRERRSVTLTDRRTLTSWIYIYNRPTEGLQQITSGDFLKPDSTS